MEHMETDVRVGTMGKKPQICLGAAGYCYRFRTIPGSVRYQLSIVQQHSRGGRAGQFRRVTHHSIESGLRVPGRRRHRFQYIDRRLLMIDPFGECNVAFSQLGGSVPQRAIRLGAADGDHRLFGERLQQVDLGVREATAFAAAHGEGANWHVPANHWDHDARLHGIVMREAKQPRLRVMIAGMEDLAVQDGAADGPVARRRHRVRRSCCFPDRRVLADSGRSAMLYQRTVEFGYRHEPEHGKGCVFGVFWSRNVRGGGSCPSRILAGPWGPSFGSFLGETDGPFLGADLRP